MLIDNEIINMKFATFYGNSYKSDIMEESDPLPFPKSVRLKCLSDEQEDLKKEITISKVKTAIDGFLPKKTSGNDECSILVQCVVTLTKHKLNRSQ